MYEEISKYCDLTILVTGLLTMLVLLLSDFKRLERYKLVNKDTIDDVDDVIKYEKKWLTISSILALFVAGSLGIYFAGDDVEWGDIKITIGTVAVPQILFGGISIVGNLLVNIKKYWDTNQLNGDEGNPK